VKEDCAKDKSRAKAENVYAICHRCITCRYLWRLRCTIKLHDKTARHVNVSATELSLLLHRKH